MSAYSGLAGNYVRTSRCIFVIVLPTCLIPRFRSFAGILLSRGGSSCLRRVSYRVWSLCCVEKGQPQQVTAVDGLLYKVYLRMSHMFVPILKNVFNRYFTQGAILSTITKGVITLLKKGGWYVWEELDDYKPITLLNTELKILSWILVNRLRIVVTDVIEPDQNYTVKGRSIQNNSSDSRDHRRNRKRHWSCADQCRSVQSLRRGGSLVSGGGFGDRRVRTGVLQID